VGIEPKELRTLHRFFADLADTFFPGKGKRSDWDPERLRAFRAEFEECRDLFRAYQQEFRATGKLRPPGPNEYPENVDPRMFAVFDRERKDEDGKPYPDRVTIDSDDWPTEATWEFLETYLDAKRRTLERYITAPPRPRPRKPRRRR
jgi:hypothetical protein